MRTFRKIIFFVSFLTFLLSFSTLAYGVLMDDGSGQGKAANLLNARNNVGIQTNQPAAASKEPGYVPNEVIVKLKAKVSPSALYSMAYSQRQSVDTNILSNLKAKYRLKDERPVFKHLHERLKIANMSQAQLEEKINARVQAKSFLKGAAKPKQSGQSIDLLPIYVLNVDEDAQAVSDRLKQDPDVEYAQPNYIRKVQMVPNDPYYNSSGSWGQPYDDLWGLKKIGCEQAWDVSQGEGVVVAVIDTGVDYTHEDLVQNIWVNTDEIPSNGIDDDHNGYVDDVNGWDFAYGNNDPADKFGHGTHCAGTIAAVGDNSIGVIGVAPRAKIMPVKGLDDTGSGYDSRLADCIIYAADNGANVLSNSWGSTGVSELLTDAFHYADSKGCICLAAAGNENADVATFQPANIDTVIAVAATDEDDLRCSFSNYGAKVDISAPGGGRVNEVGGGRTDMYNILSTMPDNSVLAMQLSNCKINNGYWRLAGTSMACPNAAGVAALLKSAYPNDSAVSIRGRMIAGTDSIDNLNPDFAGMLGSGRVNTYKSLSIAPQPILKVEGVVKNNLWPGQDGSIVIYIRNWWQDAHGVTAVLSSDNANVIIHNAELNYGDIASGEVKSNGQDQFRITLAPDMPFGSIISFSLAVTSQDGFQKTFNFKAKVSYFSDAGKETNLPLLDFLPIMSIMTDYNNDGYPDIFFIGYSDISLYRNCGDSTYVRANEEAKLPSLTYGNTALFIDIDNDGYKDLFLGTVFNGNKLFHNNGDGTFTDITQGSGLPQGSSSLSMAFDYNNDGYADILCVIDNGKAGITLLKNNGNSTFTEGYIDTGSVINWGQIIAFDYDNDGDQDIFISNCYSAGAKLYRNNGDGTFTDATSASGIEIGSRKGVAVADYNNDGYLDMYVTGCSGNPIPGALYRNNGNGTFTNVTSVSGNPGLQQYGNWWGNDFLDYDNDGNLDIYLTDSGGSEIRQDTIYHNNGNGTFTNVAEVAFPEGAVPDASAGECMGDYNNDGAVDIYAPAAAGFGQGAFLKNVIGTTKNWIKIGLEGTVSNKDAYGARVYVRAGGIVQLREIHSSPVQSNPAHFGLGSATSVDEIEIHWPSGIIQNMSHVNVNENITITEPRITIPAIAAISVNRGLPGTVVVITGRNFGSAQGGGFVVFADSKTALIQSWADTAITCAVPNGAVSGNIYVKTDNGKSNGVYFVPVSVSPAPYGLFGQGSGNLMCHILAWKDDSDTTIEYRIERSADGLTFNQIASMPRPEGAPGSIEKYSASVSYNHDYYYRVRAASEAGVSDYSNVAALPAEPTNIKCTDISLTQATITWQNISSIATSIMIIRTDLSSGVDTIVSTPPTGTTYTDTTIAGNKIYQYKVVTCTSTGQSTVSHPLKVRTKPPDAPYSLKATALSRTSIIWQWLFNFDANSLPDGFKIARSTDGSSFDEIATVSTPTTTSIVYYTNNNLTPGTTYYYKVCAYNKFGKSAYSPVASATTSINHPPVLSSIGNKTVDENTTLSFTISGTDPDNDQLTYSVAGLPSGAIFNQSTKIFTWTPAYDQAGTYTVTFTVSDGMLSASQPVTITVNRADHTEYYPSGRIAWQRFAHPEQQGNVYYRHYGDESLNRKDQELLTSADTDGAVAYTYQYFGMGPDYVVTQNEAWQAGTYSFNSLTVASGVTLTIHGPDTKLYVNNVFAPDGSVVIDSNTFTAPRLRCDTMSLGFPVTPPLHDKYIYMIGSPSRMILAGTPSTVFKKRCYADTNFSTLVMTYTYDSDGNIVSQVPGSSGGSQVILHAEVAPRLFSIGDQVTDENKSLQVVVSTWSPNNKPLTLSATNLPPGMSVSGATIKGTPTQAGTYAVSVSASDGQLTSAPQTATITVNHVNRSPILRMTANQIIEEGKALQFTVSAMDPDGDALTYSATGLPQGAAFDPATRIFTWTPTYYQAGNYTVTFTVSDGVLSVSQTIVITVNNVNGSPQIEPVGDKTVNRLELLKFRVKAVDPDNDRIIYSVLNKPLGSVFSQTTGEFRWVPTIRQAGDFIVTFIAKDSKGNQSSEMITITVPNSPPVLSPIGNKTVRVGQVLLFKLNAQDPDRIDQHLLRFYAQNMPKGASLTLSGAFTWRPDKLQTGTYKVRFYVKDPAGAIDDETITITIIPTMPSKRP